MKNRLSEVVDRIEHAHGRVVITNHGRPAAVIISLEDLASLEDRALEILSDPSAVADIRAAEAEVSTGTGEETVFILTIQHRADVYRRRGPG